MNATIRHNQLTMLVFKLLISAIIIGLSFSAQGAASLDRKDTTKENQQLKSFVSNKLLYSISFEEQPCQNQIKYLKIYDAEMELLKDIEVLLHEPQEDKELEGLLSRCEYLFSVGETSYYIYD